jgi:alpha-D-xyloside xylohydrolase
MSNVSMFIIKRNFLLLIFMVPTIAFGKVYKTYALLNDRLSIQLNNGVLDIIPLSDYVIRVQFEKDLMKEKREFILVNKLPVPQFKLYESASKLQLSTNAVNVIFDKQDGAIEFTNKKNKVFLSEIPESRKLEPDSDMGEPCYMAEQSFDSPKGEYLYGLGQFQDGHLDLRNVSRKLIQVNSQISIPFIYSSRGYGLLWHQYGLTDFNPADNSIPLTKKDTVLGGNQEVEVTTTSGTQRVSRQESLYTGKFSVKKNGEYSLMLDLGDMDSHQFLVVDDTIRIDQSNLWLPPAVSTIVRLKTGEHSVKVVCKSSNTPKLSWKLTDNETTFRSPNAKSLDYVVFYGRNADEVIKRYRNLSGNVPMLPLWAYGFWQCRERYSSSKQLVETVKEFRQKDIPMDVIVQDWQYWGNNGWGVPKFDETNYPNPSGFIKEIHDLNAHFCISIWSNPDKNSAIGKEYISNNLYIPDSKWLDYFNPATRKDYWNTLYKNLFRYGVDSWWMDATEPENDALHGEKIYLGLGDFYRITYPLFVSRAVYEGQRKTTSAKRVCILTRSAFAGQQRYGTINWSGDISGTWDSFRTQIVAGLDYMLTGMPFWTTDIGGFFRPEPSQYTDKKYHELLIRWYQWGAFNPIFRIHGYQSETEPWRYGEIVEYNMRKMLNLRYRLIPYIYSDAWQITHNGSTMMRPLVMDFNGDSTALNQQYEYMFGPSFLVVPVTMSDVSEWQVYLPQSASWYNFWTGQQIKGGQTINTAAPLDKIPLFVKAGSIVPMGKCLQYAGQKPADTLEVRIYRGANVKFTLYEDEGNNYDYEKGSYTIIPFIWNEQDKALVIGDRQGNYPGYLKKRVFNVVFVNESEGTGIAVSKTKRHVLYTGKKIKIKMK